MPLSKIARCCLESNAFFAQDILFSKNGVHHFYKQRERCGEFNLLYEELRERPEKFFEYTKMSVETFDYIIENIETGLTTADTNFQKSITAKEKLFLTLRFLSTGATFNELTHSFRCGKSTVANIIYQTCKEIWVSLQKSHMPKPSTTRLKEIAEEYYERWQFPNCIGAIGGKQFRVKKRNPSGIEYSCNKRKLSVVVQAVADADYKFISVEVGGRAKESGSGGIFQCSMLNELITNGSYKIPPPTRLPGYDQILPNVMIGDESYPLKTFLMRPYPERGLDDAKKTFNKRLSRANNCVECAFEILTNKWILFQKPIETNLTHTRLIIKAACLLHNIVRERDGNRGMTVGTITEAAERSGLRRRNKRNNRATTQAIKIRNKFKDYFHQFEPT